MPKLVNRKEVIILLSGGIDSAACVCYYIKEQFHVKALFIDYGQAAFKNEYKSAKKISNYYKIRLDIVKADMHHRYGNGEIKGRNAFFVITVIMKYPTFSGLISLGIHAGIPYYDTTSDFVADIKILLDRYTDGSIRVDAPFLHWGKSTIYAYCKKNKVPIKLTYSCEVGAEPPCGKCNSCLDRKTLNVS